MDQNSLDHWEGLNGPVNGFNIVVGNLLHAFLLRWPQPQKEQNNNQESRESYCFYIKTTFTQSPLSPYLLHLYFILSSHPYIPKNLTKIALSFDLNVTWIFMTWHLLVKFPEMTEQSISNKIWLLISYLMMRLSN